MFWHKLQKLGTGEEEGEEGCWPGMIMFESADDLIFYIH